jgi:acetate---CoA ligase (ADP-forming)
VPSTPPADQVADAGTFTRGSPAERRPILQLLAPKSVAIVGASADQLRLGWRPVRFLLDAGYSGDIYPINPAYKVIAGLTCYPDFASLPRVPEALVVAVSADRAVEVVAQASRAGAKLAVILSSGFAESGEAGVSSQRLLEAAGEMRIIGPNIPGIANLVDGIPLGWSSYLYQQPWVAGPIGLVTASGGLASPMINRAFDRKIGFSYVLAVGNQVDVDFVEAMSALVEDESTHAVACILEAVSDGRLFERALRTAADACKPVLVLKVGESSLGAQLAESHTAAIVGDAQLYRALFRAHGVVTVPNPDDLFEYGYLFARYREFARNWRTSRRPTVGVLSVSGGGAELLADKASEYGVELSELSADTTALVQGFLGDHVAALNPLDMTGYVFQHPDALRAILRGYLADPGCDIVLLGAFMNTPHIMAVLVDEVIALSGVTSKPIVFFSASGEINREPHQKLASAGIPVFFRPDQTMRALGEFSRFVARAGGFAEREPVPAAALPAALEVGGHHLAADEHGRVTESEAKQFLRRCGLPVPSGAVVTDPADLASVTPLRYPLVVKSNLTSIRHKSELGLVRLGISDFEALTTSVRDIWSSLGGLAEGEHEPVSVLVEEQASGQYEAIVSVRVDDVLGPFVVVGPGGTLVELLGPGAMAMRPCPVDRAGALEMIAETPLAPLLAGQRGRDSADKGKLADLVARISQVGAALDRRLIELECNPVLVGPDGVIVVDALLTLSVL